MVTGPGAAVLPAAAAQDYGLLLERARETVARVLERAERAEAALAGERDRADAAVAEASRLRALLAAGGRHGGAQEFLTPGEAARRLGVHPKTLYHLGALGRITSVRTPGGHRRYLPELVEKLAAELEREREARRAGQGRRRSTALCGSDPWGVARHRRDGTEVCRKCREALRAYQRDYRAGRAGTGGKP